MKIHSRGVSTYIHTYTFVKRLSLGRKTQNLQMKKHPHRHMIPLGWALWLPYSRYVCMYVYAYIHVCMRVYMHMYSHHHMIPLGWALWLPYSRYVCMYVYVMRIHTHRYTYGHMYTHAYFQAVFLQLLINSCWRHGQDSPKTHTHTYIHISAARHQQLLAPWTR